eukprot:755976-Hanusia_phi.AAC.2
MGQPDYFNGDTTTDMSEHRWSEYSDNDRRLRVLHNRQIRARLSILAPTTIAANSEDEVKELKSRYKEKYAKYEETNMKLNEWQRQFETLAADLSKCVPLLPVPYGFDDA